MGAFFLASTSLMTAGRARSRVLDQARQALVGYPLERTVQPTVLFHQPFQLVAGRVLAVTQLLYPAAYLGPVMDTSKVTKVSFRSV